MKVTKILRLPAVVDSSVEELIEYIETLVSDGSVFTLTVNGQEWEVTKDE